MWWGSLFARCDNLNYVSMEMTLADGAAAYNSSTRAARRLSTARWLIEPLSVASPASSDGGSAIRISRQMRVEPPVLCRASEMSRLRNSSRSFSFASCSGPLNYGKYCDPKIDDLLTKARTATTTPERKAIYEQAAAEILSKGGVLYLYHRTLLFAHTPRLAGFKVMPDGLIRVTDLKLQ